jgi:HAD superfamily hydrolase (TIGR01509 family)
MIKAIIFDMDGTLINSDQLVLTIYQQLTEKYKPQISFDSLHVNDVLALSYPEVLERLYGTFEQHYFDTILDLHKDLKHTYLKAYPGVFEMLKTLKEKGYLLGLFTSEMHEIAIDEMKILGLDQFFDHVIAFDDVKYPKPHPQGLLDMMNVFKCEPHEMIMVGDQLSDAHAAKSAGVYAILMDHEKSRPKHFFDMYHHVVYDTKTLMNVIFNHENMFLVMPKDQDLKMIQFTDLHLMNDEKDAKTYQLMTKIIRDEKPDFIVFTGDQTMSEHAIKLYQELGLFMDQFETPYTFVFGNHDGDGGHHYQSLIESIRSSKNLKFDQGPIHLGYSNFNITLLDEQKPVGRLTFMDSHIDDFFMIDGKKTWGYGVFSKEQIAWYQRVQSHALPHLIFYHIPLPEMLETTPEDTIHQGEYGEKPSVQGINTGFFEAARKTGQAKGMFFGHDHYNDYSYVKNGIVLAYGRVSGHYDYGPAGYARGARVITFSKYGALKTYVIKYLNS